MDPNRPLASLMDLRGRSALITGAAGHLGRVMAEALAEMGADLALVDLDGTRAEDVGRSLSCKHGIRAVGLAADLEDEAAVRALPHRAKEALGRLDILINNAAFVGTSGLEGWAVPFAEQTSDTWRRAMEVNLTACFALCQAAEPLLRESGNGSIINIGSIYGVFGPDLSLYEGTSMQNPAAYAASKGGLMQLTRWLATVLGPDIRVNAICPGGVARGQPEPFVERYVARTPLKRMATEEDFKGAAAYLASDMSSYVTGQIMMVDGGWGAW
ncbi:SDR family oxidoreductase [Roseovarius nanhaiticus]|uniref:SDR family oxidoreductase n=1 Tax=Roseovarius nanhaiticus TaxID=573024 RepID=UPI002492D873|nr:SDR family oxidoreductase [Roseovarius nanhaiticus]